jgi:hypothetical protein
MTAKNIVRRRADPDVAFWSQLKEGYDRFLATAEGSTVAVPGKRYSFLPYADRQKEAAALDRLNGESVKVAKLLAAGTPAVQVSYSDGGQHPSPTSRMGFFGDVSRPDPLPGAGAETTIPGTDAKHAFRMPAMRKLPPEPALSMTCGR